MVDYADDIRLILQAAIYGLGDPTRPDQAVPKRYVDNHARDRIVVIGAEHGGETIDINPAEHGGALIVVAANNVTFNFPLNRELGEDDPKMAQGMRVMIYPMSEREFKVTSAKFNPTLEYDHIKGRGVMLAFVYVEETPQEGDPDTKTYDQEWLVMGDLALDAITPIPPAGDIRLTFYTPDEVNQGLYADDQGFLWLVPDGMGVPSGGKASIGNEGSGATLSDNRLQKLYLKIHGTTLEMLDTKLPGRAPDDWSAGRAIVIPDLSDGLIKIARADVGTRTDEVKLGSGTALPVVPVTFMISLGERE